MTGTTCHAPQYLWRPSDNTYSCCSQTGTPTGWIVGWRGRQWGHHTCKWDTITGTLPHLWLGPSVPVAGTCTPVTRVPTYVLGYIWGLNTYAWDWDNDIGAHTCPNLFTGVKRAPTPLLEGPDISTGMSSGVRCIHTCNKQNMINYHCRTYDKLSS